MITNKIANIQILRAFAALNVVFFHIIFNANIYGYSVVFFDFLNGWGSSGVDLFFVISGFIIIYIQNLKNKSPFSFFKDRLLRIIPAYWFFCISLSMLLVFMPFLFKEMNFSSTWFLSSILFISGFLMHKDPIIFVGWTIEYEMLFYLIFAVSIFIRPLIISVVVTGFSILTLVIFTNVDYIMLEFTFGMIIGVIYIKDGVSPYFSKIFFSLGVFIFLLSIALKDEGINRVVLYGLPAFLIVLGCIGLSQIKSESLIRVGDASFSIYLIQIYTIPAFYKCIKYLNLSAFYSDFMAICCLFSTVVSGYLFYICYEKRIEKFFKYA